MAATINKKAKFAAKLNRMNRFLFSMQRKLRAIRCLPKENFSFF